jgi:hypothetical protein
VLSSSAINARSSPEMFPRSSLCCGTGNERKGAFATVAQPDPDYRTRKKVGGDKIQQPGKAVRESDLIHVAHWDIARQYKPA